MTALLLSLGLAAATPTWTGALGFLPDAVYAAGQRVELPAHGLSFVIPEGWGGGAANGGSTIVLGSVEEVGLILVYPETEATVASARQWMSTVQQLEGLELDPRGAVVVDEGRITGRFTVGDGGRRISAVAAARVSDAGLALFAVAIGPADHAAEQQVWVVGIVDSAQVDGLPLPPPRRTTLVWP